MGYINELTKNILADYESDVYSIDELSEKYDVGAEFILNLIMQNDQKKKGGKS